MPSSKKGDPASSPIRAPSPSQSPSSRKGSNRIPKPATATEMLKGRAKMSAPSKGDAKQAQLKMAIGNKDLEPSPKAGGGRAAKSCEPRVTELKKMLTTVVGRASTSPAPPDGGGTSTAATFVMEGNTSADDPVASGAGLVAGSKGVNKARKSFPVASEAADRVGVRVTRSSPIEDPNKLGVHQHQKKHKKRFFRGGTYGLYLSARRKRRRHQMTARKATGESDESGAGDDTLSEDPSSLQGDEVSSEHSSLASSRMTEDTAREFPDKSLEDRLFEEESLADGGVAPASPGEGASFPDHAGKVPSAKKTIQKASPLEDSSVLKSADPGTPVGVLDEVLAITAMVVSGKENSHPVRNSQGAQGALGNIRVTATSGATERVLHHASSIASSVKSRQRIKRRIMEDHVDVDEVSMCSSTSASPETSSANAMKKPRKGSYNGGVPPTLPFSQADTNINCSYIKMEVVYDLRFPAPTKCCCLAKPLDSVSMKASDPRTYCQALDSVHGRIVGCTRVLSEQLLVRPSVRIPFAALCEAHMRRLRLHHCCPQCGVFCTQGEFLQCGEGPPHLFHRQCQLQQGEEACCPHCGRSSALRTVRLEAKAARTPVFYLGQKVPSPVPRARMSCTRGREVSATPAAARPTVEPQGEQVLVEATGAMLSADSLPLCAGKKELELLLRGVRAEKPTNIRPTSKTLFTASKTGELERALQDIVSGVDVNVAHEDQNGATALHAAAAAGHLAIVHLLIQAGAQVESQDAQLYTPLMRAVDARRISVVHYLLKVGADPKAKGEDGMTCLHLAARCGSLDVCNIFLGLDIFPINVQDDGGWTPLVWASEHRRVEIVRLLLSKGADPNIRDGEENTALHWSAFSGNVEISWMYLQRGSDVNAVNEHGDTPLHIAARQDNYDAVVLLMNHGAQLDLVNKSKDTPIACCKDEKSQSFALLTINQELARILKDKNQKTERVLHKDISRGKELNLIQCVNGVDDEPTPSDYLYLVENCETTPILIDRTITSLQSCKCEDGCASQSCICSNISYRCWYGKEGRLVPEFNMLDPPMLFECSRACLCWSNCYNRVVQNGITCHLQLFRTRGKGWGVRTLQDIPRGTFVCEYIGEILSDSEADKREDDSYLFDLENRDGETYCLDARYYGNISRFVNHLCEPNLVPVRVFVDHQDLSFPRMAFFSSKDIKANEELGFDYGEKFWIIKYKMFTCECDSEKCKYSKDKIQETLLNYNRRIREESGSCDAARPLH
ncbi:histone-lysine N-methyltransferase EHMT2 isoform X2 [Ixodes scapularis]|uniref:histone-lysine N-methyltransferase EHMT2 isoform X2 n=1 Tax=Ixodes scapularis TaxID=6945 RepID=UPI001C393C25|nr:histone-lysine N-methyltransferase EHMT2 isoform X2 [Ixodes scapularis]XP_040355922.2 histone-lysine N-methyltransferase EHMT2 isoform X2 [Ixodes scapularis]